MSEPHASRTLQQLGTRRVTKGYNGREVVGGVDINVRRGEVVGLLGPNGAGKTTTFAMIVGYVRPDGGAIVLDDRDITPLPMYQRSRLGIGYLAQEPSIFRRLTVEENILAILETLAITDRSYLMAEGRVLIAGNAHQLINDTKAREIYLGPKFQM